VSWVEFEGIDPIGLPLSSGLSLASRKHFSSEINGLFSQAWVLIKMALAGENPLDDVSSQMVGLAAFLQSGIRQRTFYPLIEWSMSYLWTQSLYEVSGF